MKAVFAVFILTAAAWGADAPSGKVSSLSSEGTAVASVAPPTTILTDSVEVFQKAFWRRPLKGDVIRQAERQEWKNETGVTQWRWFIVVKPSPELLKHLRDHNAFNLVSVPSAPLVKDAPQWFTPPAGATDVLRAPQGEMKLVFDRKDGLLYASDAGGGFHPGKIMEPETPPASSDIERRPFKLPPER